MILPRSAACWRWQGTVETDALFLFSFRLYSPESPQMYSLASLGEKKLTRITQGKGKELHYQILLYAAVHGMCKVKFSTLDVHSQRRITAKRRKKKVVVSFYFLCTFTFRVNNPDRVDGRTASALFGKHLTHALDRLVYLSCPSHAIAVVGYKISLNN